MAEANSLSDIFDEDVMQNICGGLRQDGLDLDNIDLDMEDHKYPIQSVPRLDEYNTMDPSTIQRMQIPCRDAYPGVLNFELLLESQSAGRNWVYSSVLEKVYINMEQSLPVKFKWNPFYKNLWVRAAMMFSMDSHQAEPVQRCHNHLSSMLHSNVDFAHPKHVLRCLHSASVYADNNGHLSVRAPLGTPHAGTDYVPMLFQFYCKNSCSSGMNRRPTELVFTLETCQEEVLGRQKLSVRVCSCPKRDRDKEEREKHSSLIPKGKKRKLTVTPNEIQCTNQPIESLDTQIYRLPPIEIIGKQNYNTMLTMAHGLMLSMAQKTGQWDFLKPFIDKIGSIEHV